MPESTTNGHNGVNGTTEASTSTSSSTPLELLKAVKEVQERRISVWREYDDAFDTFLGPASSFASPGPVNGSLNSDSQPSRGSQPESETANGSRGCSGCSTTTVPLSEDLLAQILQFTTQALIECGHRLRAIQTELAHSSAPNLATLADRIQTKENALLRTVVQRDQLRKTTFKPSEETRDADRDEAEAKERIAELDGQVKETRGEISELMQEVYAESLELQLAED